MVRTAAALVLMMSSGGTLAQTSAPAMSGRFVTDQARSELRASKFVGVDVYGSDDRKIGDVSEILMDALGNAKTVVIGVGAAGEERRPAALGRDRRHHDRRRRHGHHHAAPESRGGSRFQRVPGPCGREVVAGRPPGRTHFQILRADASGAERGTVPAGQAVAYSHSIVPGGFEVTS